LYSLSLTKKTLTQTCVLDSTLTPDSTNCEVTVLEIRESKLLNTWTQQQHSAQIPVSIPASILLLRSLQGCSEITN